MSRGGGGRRSAVRATGAVGTDLSWGPPARRRLTGRRMVASVSSIEGSGSSGAEGVGRAGRARSGRGREGPGRLLR
jgi:hypothetical protein